MSDDFVLVTGGARGIGEGISRRLIDDGYRVIVFDIVEPDAELDVEFHQVDLMNVDETRGALDSVIAQREVTRLVNNVGIVRPAVVEDTTVEDLEDVFNLNTRAALLCVQALLPTMRARSHGRIVSITSRVVLGKELRTAYSGSKAALTAMTRTWALELAGDGITVNAVAPGPIGTEAFFTNNPPDSDRTRKIIDGVPVGRLGSPEDIAHAVSYFLDDRSGFVTGQTLFVCGGMTVGLTT